MGRPSARLSNFTPSGDDAAKVAAVQRPKEIRSLIIVSARASWHWVENVPYYCRMMDLYPTAEMCLEIFCHAQMPRYDMGSYLKCGRLIEFYIGVDRPCPSDESGRSGAEERA